MDDVTCSTASGKKMNRLNLRATIIGIAGCTNSGKTTLAEKIKTRVGKIYNAKIYIVMGI